MKVLVPILLVVAYVAGCAAGPCRGLGLARSEVGPSAWYFEICDGGRSAEVFVDGVRWTRACRRAGTVLRCHVNPASAFPHRLNARVLGRGILRCTVSRPGAKPDCCINCPARKSKKKPAKPRVKPPSRPEPEQ